MSRTVSDLNNLVLFRQCMRATGDDRGDLSPADAEKLAAMVRGLADKVEPLLKQIPITFRQYTEHDIGHSLNLIYLMGKIVPAETLRKLNALELALAMCAALVHDAGMYMDDPEKQRTLSSARYRDYLLQHPDRLSAAEAARAHGLDVQARLIEDALLAEFIRQRHAERSRAVLEDCKEILRFHEVDLWEKLADLSESHAWPVRSADAQQAEQSIEVLPVDWMVGNVAVNLQYLACLLRLADILDFDRSRTPLGLFEHLEFTEAKSWEEWNKHLQVTGWKFSKDQVRFQAECSSPRFYVAIQEFLCSVDDELRECRYLLDEAPRTVPKHYVLALPPLVDRRGVVMRDKRYVAGSFRFTLDFERVTHLLMDKTLYPDPSLFLRELLQNALDSCRVAEARAKAAGVPYEPRIVVWDHSADETDPTVIVQDNGIGMSQRAVENYFMRVGRSFYRSAEFEAEREKLQQQNIVIDVASGFGIGILSCFLAADRFEVLTLRYGEEKLEIAVEGPTKYFVIRRLGRARDQQFRQRPSGDDDDGPLADRPGTRICVHLRKGTPVDVAGTLRKYAVNLDYEVHVHGRSASAPESIARLGFERPVSVEPEMVAEAAAPGSRVPFISTWWQQNRPIEIESLNRVLVASRIPFEQWEFSRHIRGNAWFWLLRGADGQACPQAGFLRMGRSLGVTGLVQRVGVFWPGYFGQDADRVGARLREWLEQTIRSGQPCEAPDSLPPEGSNPVLRLLAREAEMWRSLSAETRLLVLQAVLDRLDAHPTHEWCQDRDAPLELLEGRIEVLRRRLGYDAQLLSPSRSAQVVAAHGVLVPAGICDWDTVHARVDTWRLLLAPGGVRIDFRGRGPMPAASRLFIPADSEGIAPFFQAVLRHALSLVGDRVTDPAWREWVLPVIDSAARALSANPKVWEEELRLITDQLPFACRLEGRIVFLKRSEIIARFGPVIARGLVVDGELSQVLLSQFESGPAMVPRVDLSHYRDQRAAASASA